VGLGHRSGAVKQYDLKLPVMVEDVTGDVTTDVRQIHDDRVG